MTFARSLYTNWRARLGTLRLCRPRTFRPRLAPLDRLLSPRLASLAGRCAAIDHGSPLNCLWLRGSWITEAGIVSESRIARLRGGFNLTA